MLQRALRSSIFLRAHFRPFATHVTAIPENINEESQTFVFQEEPLGLPASKGFGFFQGTPLDVIGPGNQFHLKAKLGHGTYSSVWLAKDSVNQRPRALDRYVALKILSGYASKSNGTGFMRELAVHERLASLPVEDTKHCNRLITHFKHKSIDEDGEHLCLALELERTTVNSVWKAKEPQYIPIPIVKRILRHMLHGIAALHKSGAVHTDIKLDNVMVSMTPNWSDDAVSAWVSSHPARTYDDVQVFDKVVTTFVSEEFPPPTAEELGHCNFKIGDFSNAQEVHDQTTDNITPFTLRAPEVLLGGRWNEKVDIWTFGCLIFMLLTRQDLFPSKLIPDHIPHLRPGIDPNAEGIEVDNLLWSMVTILQKTFPLDMLSFHEGSSKYFEPDGMMKRFRHYGRWSLERCFRDTRRPASKKDVVGACALMRRCLKYAPLARASAEKLLEDPWLKDADV